MLKPVNRLSKKADIDRVFKNRGISAYTGNIGVKAAQNNLKNTRFTIVVSLKVSKKAVLRNKLKRQIREIIRLKILPEIKQGYDCVIITKKELIGVPFEELENLVIKIFKKAKLF